MARRICEDPPAAGVDVEEGGAEAEDLLLSVVKVRYIEIQVKLLRVRAVRPPWRPVIIHALKRKYQARARVEGRKVIADRPPGIGLVDCAAKEPLIEPCELKDIRTVQNHALQLADHWYSSIGAAPLALVSHGPTRAKAQRRAHERADLSRIIRQSRTTNTVGRLGSQVSAADLDKLVLTARKAG